MTDLMDLASRVEAGDLIAARQTAAAAYPDFLVDTKGRQHRCIPREAILAGKYDDGDVVRRHIVPAYPQGRAA